MNNTLRPLARTLSAVLAGMAFSPWAAAATAPHAGPMVGPVPLEFIFFGAVLAGVAMVHLHALKIAVGGALVIALYKVLFSPFAAGAGTGGLAAHLGHEWVVLANLLLLLLGFALLAKHFEDSEVPAMLPAVLPDDWKGCFVLLLMVFVLSAFLDNIAAAMIGGAVAHTVFKGRVHIGYLAAIVAASNAGGAGSVVGDTTTTMMWIAGVSPTEVFEAYIAAGTALVVFGIPAALKQQAYAPIQSEATPGAHIDWARVGVVIFILAASHSMRPPNRWARTPSRSISVNRVAYSKFAPVSGIRPLIASIHSVCGPPFTRRYLASGSAPLSRRALFFSMLVRRGLFDRLSRKELDLVPVQ